MILTYPKKGRSVLFRRQTPTKVRAANSPVTRRFSAAQMNRDSLVLNAPMTGSKCVQRETTNCSKAKGAPAAGEAIYFSQSVWFRGVAMDLRNRRRGAKNRWLWNILYQPSDGCRM
jgi:hypothetical protein